MAKKFKKFKGNDVKLINYNLEDDSFLKRI